MTATVLGSGTSTGLPVLACGCSVCQSKDERNQRLRSSILLHKKNFSVLVDCGPDVRQQLLREQVHKLDAVLLTHIHYDHVGGLDDLRPLSYAHANGLNCFSDSYTQKIILRNHPHLQQWKKIQNLPRLNIATFTGDFDKGFSSFFIDELEVQPIRLMHVQEANLHSIGFVFNKTFAYLTDFKYILPKDEKFLYDLNVMMVGAPLLSSHKNHVSIDEAMKLILYFRAKKGYITHLAHDISHKDLIDYFSSLQAKHILPCYDGQKFNF